MNTLSLSIPELATGTVIGHAVDDAADSRLFDLTGAQGGSLAPFLAQLAERRHCQVVVVTPGPSEARALAQDLLYYLRLANRDVSSDSVLLCPAYDFSPYDGLAPDRLMIMQRTGVLFKLAYGADWRFLVVSADAMARRLVPRAAFEAGCLPIVRGEKIERDTLVEYLDGGGYHRAPLVEEPGTYAVRGSLIDVFPPYLTHPARIDLFGSDVEKIRLFNPADQSGADEVEEVWIHPVRLALLTNDQNERQNIAQRIRTVCDAVNQPTGQTEQVIEDVFSRRVLVGAEGLHPAFHSPLGGLIDYFPENISICLNHPSAIRIAWGKQESALSSDYALRIEDRVPAFSPERHIVLEEELTRYVTSRSVVRVHPLAVASSSEELFSSGEKDAVDLKAVSTSDLGDRLRNLQLGKKVTDLVGSLATYLLKLEDLGYKTAVVAHTSGQSQRLASMLKGRGVKVGSQREALLGPGVIVEEGELSRGCLLPAEGLCYIAEEEVFGRRRRRSAGARRKKISFDDLRQLSPGDLIVHVEHGIGRYDGLVRQVVRHSEMDFLLLVYKGGDKLYLPVYRLNQVQKYKGAGGQERLDKLGGQTFSRAKAEALVAARDMAGKLLDLYARRQASSRPPAKSIDDDYRSFEASFPFEETDDQDRAIEEVMADLNASHPMDRLVCGDVGFGKTEVAMRAAFRVVMSGLQVAILVPTTVLAQQHYQTFKTRFSEYPVHIEVLSRFSTPASNKETVFGLKDGTVDIVVGTHRLLSKDVHFRRLGLLIIDEEHRFGVTHKERIRSLRASVDTLVLTATPIPRTLQMAFGGVRDLSLIGTAPSERRSVKTIVCHDDNQILRQAIERELAREGQVFFVHNRVKDIGRVQERVQQLVPDARIAVGHGQMKETELERVMLDFVAGRYDILICTSIIESGLDIPRANTIIIDRADTFGMAQLYQLRGRVGRSHHQAYAYLLIPPLSILGEEAKERVQTLARYSDLGSGFSVATMDLEIRGAGNLLGHEQSGSIQAVGFEMFYELLSEAAADLRGEEARIDIEPELTFDTPGFIAEDYLPDVGQRLQYYKRLASAASEEEAQSIAAELTDRFGVLPPETENFVKVMVVKALSRGFGIRGVESTTKRLIVHLASDSRIDPDVVIKIVKEARGAVQLTEDLKIKVRFNEEDTGGVDGAIRFLHRLGSYDINPSIL